VSSEEKGSTEKDTVKYSPILKSTELARLEAKMFLEEEVAKRTTSA
jgi:hypothetical protein